MRLLLVEDEERMANLLRRGLGEEGHLVDTCRTAEDALDQAGEVAYDAIILDWALPGMDGVALLRRWRERGLMTPVLMLTARGTVGERVTGLRAGADDYLVKPFAFEELLARLEALHRRSEGQTQSWGGGAIHIDARRRMLTCGDREVALTGREFALLGELASRAGEVHTRSSLLAKVWGPSFDGPPNIVDVYVGYVRAKLTEVGAEGVTIQAVRGVGFRLVIEGAR
ncbi:MULTISPECIES: response regulator transcription factor [Myxococcus]|uniref:Response regulator transcription factor n=1 Tax=Myxococcus xanthus TaxID=34 RepID=A0A7Y4IQY4_MYXXA|nr:response regulator transcription factor [Myxococcus sp. AB056]NOJ83360.1 response regulator transcription factor [Myxococcus xanthus]NOJ90703.1 response regulator transcription factor [Myxococcus xanthus]